MPLTQTAPPASLPLTVAEAKAHSRVFNDAEDDLIEGWIGAAVDYLDGPTGVLGRAIMQQVWRLDLEQWPDRMALPIEPVSAVAVSYFDSDGNEAALDDGVYRLDQWPGMAAVLVMEDGQIMPDLYTDRAYPVLISATAGYADAAAVPKGLKQLISMLAAHWYENREAVLVGTNSSEMPLGVATLLARYRVKT